MTSPLLEDDGDDDDDCMELNERVVDIPVCTCVVGVVLFVHILGAYL